MNHDITFTREGDTVKVCIQTDLPLSANDRTPALFPFTRRCASVWEAELLLRYLEERHKSAIQAIREMEFLSGWKHGRAKKHGLSWFADWFASHMRPEATYR